MYLEEKITNMISDDLERFAVILLIKANEKEIIFISKIENKKILSNPVRSFLTLHERHESTKKFSENPTFIIIMICCWRQTKYRCNEIWYGQIQKKSIC